MASIAQQIFDYYCEHGLTPRLHILDKSEKEFHIENEPLVVIVISSTGDGDPPENASRFMRRICRKTLPADFLANTRFALLGLGDSNYSTYQGVPKKLEKQLLALGAKSILKRGEADDQVGLELVVEPWIKLLHDVINAEFGIAEREESTVSPVVAKHQQKPMDSSSSEDGTDDHPMLRVATIQFPEEGPCLIRGYEDLSSNENLKVPAMPVNYIVSAVTHERITDEEIVWQNNAAVPGMENVTIEARIVGTNLLTEPTASKPKCDITLDLGKDWEDKLNYEAGDAYYFIAQNPVEEVNFVLKKCGVLELADQVLNIGLDTKTEKKRAALPPYIPAKCSLRNLFTYCLDIRRAPGRPLLRVLAECTQDEGERRRLLELVSVQGAQDFNNYVRGPNISLCDLLLAFPSCVPEADRLIELLPRLMPRPYSVASYDAFKKRRITFVYSLMTFDVQSGRQYERRGLCSDWMSTLKVGDIVKIKPQVPTRFRIPVCRDVHTPCENLERQGILMIGPGTGVAPFISFLEKCGAFSCSGGGRNIYGDDNRSLLFFGCRDLQVDGFYIRKMQDFLQQKVLTDLVLCESQPAIYNERPRYVQEGLWVRKAFVYDFITKRQGRIFVCGDALGMSKDVFDCFVGILMSDETTTKEEATKILMEMKAANCYIEDVWS
ncbi:hypothetical protein L596_001833 [Steinernema carpocapsae]|uniref:Methionine synthase reductase n=1 Tax=Steinernema carpocapsae TaxID=34508 RepID=A0A4U8UMD3_STECR|nr:hypothetical protein L596_001833 [Steinernema carpocapsae]